MRLAPLKSDAGAAPRVGAGELALLASVFVVAAIIGVVGVAVVTLLVNPRTHEVRPDEGITVQQLSGVWLAGFSTGGSLAICVAGEDPRVRGVASFEAPADFHAWAEDPSRFLAEAQAIARSIVSPCCVQRAIILVIVACV